MTITSHDFVVPSWTIHDRLVKARSVRGLSQQSLADELGVSLRTVNRWELGVTKPTRAALIAWAFACGVDPGWLIDGDQDDPPLSATSVIGRYPNCAA